MRFVLKSALAAAAVSLLGACASSGGGSSDDTLGVLRTIFCAGLVGRTDCPAAAGANDSAPPQNEYARPALTSWSDQQGETVQATGPQVAIRYEFVPATAGSLRPVLDPVFTDARNVGVYLSNTQVQYFDAGDVELFYGKKVDGQPGIEALHYFNDTYSTTREFSDTTAASVGLLANPSALAWDFQSFGVWNRRNAMQVTAGSYGAATPGGSGVPTSGAANFAGKLAGMYISPSGEGSTVAANLEVQVDFSRRTLSLASSGTSLWHDPAVAGAAPHLDLSGTLSYAPGSSSFSGTLANAGGTMSGTSNGQFYGPAAQELGGVFALKSATTVETLIGAYGAKR